MARKRGSNTGIPGLSFSWKRASGVTNIKRKISKTTGIPTTKTGRQQKIGKMVTQGGCLVSVGVFCLMVFILWKSIFYI